MKIMDKCTGEVTGSSPATRAKSEKSGLIPGFSVLPREHPGTRTPEADEPRQGRAKIRQNFMPDRVPPLAHLFGILNI